MHPIGFDKMSKSQKKKWLKEHRTMWKPCQRHRVIPNKKRKKSAEQLEREWKMLGY